jgi:hypothetical protein
VWATSRIRGMVRKAQAKPADPSRFLADDVIFQAEFLIGNTRLHLPHTNLGDHILGVANRLPQVRSGMHREGRSMLITHSPRKPRIDIKPFGILVHHPDLGDGNLIQP